MRVHLPKRIDYVTDLTDTVDDFRHASGKFRIAGTLEQIFHIFRIFDGVAERVMRRIDVANEFIERHSKVAKALHTTGNPQ